MSLNIISRLTNNNATTTNINTNNSIKLKHLFPQMAKHPHWIGVAFRRGTFYEPYDALIMTTTLGTHVHCELLIGQGANCRAYASYNNPDLDSGFTQSINVFDPKCWEVLALPVKSTDHAQTLALQLLDEKLPYNHSDLWQCCVKTMLPFEKDVDCDYVQSWKPRGVFCSQMCLLFLRNLLHREQLEVPEQLQHHLHAVHSRGCSPNMLHALLQQFFVKL